MNNVGVVGAGTMGIGIVQVAASQGCNVFLYDVNASRIKTAMDGLRKILDRQVEKGRMTHEEVIAILNRIQFCNSFQDFQTCDLVVEAIIENKEAKEEVFRRLESVVPADSILATNTSAISITSLSSELKNPERFLGIHFFNPAPLMPLVEVIPGLLTDENLPRKISDLMKTWGKAPVIAGDQPGFIVNRIARPFYGEALRIVEEKIATPEQVDDAMKTLGRFKMGPFELMDLIGIDVNFAVTKTVYKDYFYEPKYKPSLLQQRMTEAKLWGRKTGKGFYNYAEGAEKPTPEKNEALYQQIFMRIISMLINEAVEAKRLKIASEEDIELAMQKGVNYPKGLLAWGKAIGYQKVSDFLQSLHHEYQEERYRQSPLLRQLAKSH